MQGTTETGTGPATVEEGSVWMGWMAATYGTGRAPSAKVVTATPGGKAATEDGGKAPLEADATATDGGAGAGGLCIGRGEVVPPSLDRQGRPPPAPIGERPA